MTLIDRDALLTAYDEQHEGKPGKARKLIEDAPEAVVRSEINKSKEIPAMDCWRFIAEKIPAMDCWHFIAPLIPINSETIDIYVATFRAFQLLEKEQEERRTE